jgi:anti-sigma regulatory factor (Ser/Thr protein kinase)
MVERRFPRNLGSLESISMFVATYLRSRGIDPEHAYTVDLLIEELFTNQLKHAKGGGPEVSLGLAGEEADLAITLRDFNVESFDPTSAPREAAPGGEDRGLGLRLVRHLSDSMRYEYKERSAVITVTKKLTP